MMGDIIEDDEWDAEVFVAQLKEWFWKCSKEENCPAFKIFHHMVAQDRRIKRLEHALKHKQEFPDEG